MLNKIHMTVHHGTESYTHADQDEDGKALMVRFADWLAGEKIKAELRALALDVAIQPLMKLSHAIECIVAAMAEAPDQPPTFTAQQARQMESKQEIMAKAGYTYFTDPGVWARISGASSMMSWETFSAHTTESLIAELIERGFIQEC